MATNRGSVVTQVRYRNAVRRAELPPVIAGVKDHGVPQFAPGKSYHFKLRCSLCDYCLEYERKGPGDAPMVDCPNCLRTKGLPMKMFPSLK